MRRRVVYSLASCFRCFLRLYNCPGTSYGERVGYIKPMDQDASKNRSPVAMDLFYLFLFFVITVCNKLLQASAVGICAS